jgi:hypothetical protein
VLLPSNQLSSQIQLLLDSLTSRWRQ